MTKVAVVYHSGYGHTQRMAQAVAEGAAAELIAIDAEGNLSEAAWATLGAADAIIMGSPTYMGSVSWQFKKFADASSKQWFSQAWKDKIAAGFTNSAGLSGDKLSTLNSIFTLAMQHSMIWASQGLMPRHQGRHPQRHQQCCLLQWRHGAIAFRRIACRNVKGRPGNGKTVWQTSCRSGSALQQVGQPRFRAIQLLARYRHREV